MTTKHERRRRKRDAAKERRPDPSVTPRGPMGLWDWIETWVDDEDGIGDSLTSGGLRRRLRRGLLAGSSRASTT